MLSRFTIREFQPADILLKRGQMPEEIYIVILGEIQILGQTREEKMDHEIITIKTDPGTRTAALI